MYELSGDEVGLLKHLVNKDGEKFFYHIHSDELTAKERQLRDHLLKEEKRDEDSL